MIEIRITKDIGDFEPKLIGPLTKRQIICVLIGAPFCFFIYRLTSPYLPVDVAGFLCFIPAGIAFLFGWIKPYGIKTEKFIKSIGVNILMAPTRRPYKTENTHEKMLRTLEQQEREAAEAATPSSKKKKATRVKEKVAKRQTPEYYL